MEISLSKQQEKALSEKVARHNRDNGTELSIEEFLAQAIINLTGQYAEETKAEFASSPQVRAIAKKLESLDPEKIADVSAAVEIAQKAEDFSTL